MLIKRTFSSERKAEDFLRGLLFWSKNPPTKLYKEGKESFVVNYNPNDITNADAFNEHCEIYGLQNDYE
jgi:hypothetical protein